jgi:hypothetical protein
MDVLVTGSNFESRRRAKRVFRLKTPLAANNLYGRPWAEASSVDLLRRPFAGEIGTLTRFEAFLRGVFSPGSALLFPICVAAHTTRVGKGSPKRASKQGVTAHPIRRAACPNAK